MNPITITVYVSGGNVQGVRTNSDLPIGIDIFDVDNLEAEGKSKEEIELLWNEVKTQCPRPIH
jgi:hypothetical protein